MNMQIKILRMQIRNPTDRRVEKKTLLEIENAIITHKFTYSNNNKRKNIPKLKMFFRLKQKIAPTSCIY